MELETVVKAIPVILMAGILLYVVVQYIEFGSDSVDREACRDSILLKERSKILGRPLIGDINCKTNLVEIDSSEEEEIYKIISEEMYDCWYQFGEGKKDFLDDHDFGRGDNWCFVCSRIDLNEENLNQNQLYGLLNYLKTEPVPLTEDTFFDYFYGENSGSVNAYIPDESGVLIDPSQSIYISFLGDKRVDAYQIGKESTIALSLGTAGGCLVGGVIGFFAGAGAGAIPGCAAGAKIGYTASVAFTAYEYSSVKHDFVPILYVGDADGAKEMCNI
jgi:hypothetical protein